MADPVLYLVPYNPKKQNATSESFWPHFLVSNDMMPENEAHLRLLMPGIGNRKCFDTNDGHLF